MTSIFLSLGLVMHFIELFIPKILSFWNEILCKKGTWYRIYLNYVNFLFFLVLPNTHFPTKKSMPPRCFNICWYRWKYKLRVKNDSGISSIRIWYKCEFTSPVIIIITSWQDRKNRKSHHHRRFLHHLSIVFIFISIYISLMRMCAYIPAINLSQFYFILYFLFDKYRKRRNAIKVLKY